MAKKEMFSDFEPATKTMWMEKVQQELKGKPFETLLTELGEDIKLQPLYTQEDIAHIDHSVLSNYNPDWQVGETFEVEEVKAANKEVLNALMNGINAPVFYLKNPLSLSEMKTLFHEVGVQYIYTHFKFAFEVEYTNFFELWLQLLQDKGIENPEEVPVFFDFDPIESQADEASLQAFAKLVKSNPSPQLKTIHIDVFRWHTNEHHVKKELDGIIEKTEKYFNFLKKAAVDLNKAIEQMYISIAIGSNYLVAIAKIRALKLRWLALLEKHQIKTPKLPFIKASFAHNTYGTDQQDNLINATTMAMSAVLGGVNHLTVRPTGNNSSDKRYARNIQLILKHESNFHLVADPAQGSYYIEKLTEVLT